MKPLKDALLSVRMTHGQKARLLEIERLSGLTRSILVTEAIESVYALLQQYGSISVPFRLVPADRAVTPGSVNG
jgi:hypothetical protein